jgi:signal transduction histidine kinase
MLTALSRLPDFFHALVRQRLVLPVLALLAAGVLVASEVAYRETVSSLRGGIALTDQRVESAQLLQLLTEMETAEFGYLLTRQNEYMSFHERTRADIPAVRKRVIDFIEGMGEGGAASAVNIDQLIARELAASEQAMTLAAAGDLTGATALSAREQGRLDMQALRDALRSTLANAATLQGRARVSIYDTLAAGRLAVGLLTLAAMLSIFLFIRQLLKHDQRDRTERARLEVEVRSRTVRLNELALHFQTVREDERSRLARELHDELGALLTVSKLEIARVKSKAGNPDDVLAGLDRVIQTLNQGIALKRQIIEDLSPSSLTHLGLTIALQNLCQDMSATLGVPIQCSLVELDLNPAANLAVYRFVQEALTNVGKYASASTVEVELRCVLGNASVTVRDNGVGFDAQTSRSGRHGLSGMQFRAESLGGSFSVESSGGSGATLRMEFVQAANRAAAT